jgi:hypothetical protein
MNLCARPVSAVFKWLPFVPQRRDERRADGSRAEIAELGPWILSQRERVRVRENGNGSTRAAIRPLTREGFGVEQAAGFMDALRTAGRPSRSRF